MDTDTHPIDPLPSYSPMYPHREPSIMYTESPFAPPPRTTHANETGNVPPKTTDEVMDDGTKDPGPFQQGSDPAAEPEEAVAENMDESMDDDETRDRPAMAKSTQAHSRSLTEKQRRNTQKNAKKRAKKIGKFVTQPSKHEYLWERPPGEWTSKLPS